jgi:hypothetical protein
VSFLTKLRKTIHTTPVLREVSQGFANAFGAGKAYSEFDAKIGISSTGEPVPSQDQYQGFGRSDLAAMAAERYPTSAALVDAYRQYSPRPSGRPTRSPADEKDSQAPARQGFGDEEPLEEDFGDDYYDDYGDEV